MAEAEVFAPLKVTNVSTSKGLVFEDQLGGYLINELNEISPMIRTMWYQKNPIKQAKPIYDYLNKIQKVAWKFNPFVVAVAEELMERRISVGKFLPSD